MKNFIKQFGTARLTIVILLVVLLVTAFFNDMNVSTLLNDSLLRVLRHGVLVLALLPGIRGGIGFNFGLPLGILCGLLGMVFVLDSGMVGVSAFATALALATLFSVVMGLLYGWLLNRVRGQEMMVGTYVGFAMVSLMSIFWLMYPFKNPTMIWALGGKGLRTTLSLAGTFGGILDQTLKFKIGTFIIPTGALLFFALMCTLVYFYLQSRWGVALTTAGKNERFARLSGVDPSRQRIIATVFSTILSAIGAVVYSQSYGFVQLYQAPLMMAFPIVACLLIGGGDLKSAQLSHVIIGTLIFQTLLTIALPVASVVIGGDISETARIIISNGIILYALTGLSNKSS